MIKNKIKYFFNNLKVLTKKSLKCLKFIPRFLKTTEKVVLGVLFVAIAIAAFFIWQNHWIKTTHEAPAFGGTLVEGIVGEAKDLDKHTARLTGAGLTRLEENGDVKGDLAEGWEIKDDGKTYQFKIRSGYSANDLLSQIQNKNTWSSIDMSAPDDQTLVFKFKSPFSPFLYVSTEPLFNYGPYQITKEQKDQVTLTANKNYWQGSPYIQNIQINLYENKDLLTKAAKRGEIMGYLENSTNNVQMSNSQTFGYNLPRELNLFFNLSKADLQDINIRRALRDGKTPGKTLNLVLATSDSDKNEAEAQRLKDTWATLGVNLEIKTYDNVALQKDIIPNRTYDLLLYGQDYGPDPDPYPFWHSSQIGTAGANLANFSNKPADKLLEDARQTFDFTVRDQKYKAFRDILADQVPYINLEKTSVNYIVSNKVKDINKVFGFSEADRFLNVNQWYIKSKRVK
ncbi:TPA: hypothetical protein DD449_05250 [Candidatus Berkelbacteria bacterium]|uniref:Putative ABC transporter substrate binding protein n=1 Tax=Berkelbacteria bacterium GW2011_GWE1_39_12 TaxID=1618337 RepID=A0A0G4B4D0_9BACT|nr:MAG: putative ABC transporter substrate binding protein [Berkelbacteria bacterium GW2011_GWE1_39_12]HBO61057.1 hypothetical protein [Candidatus Berkelbacteria bacterium]